MKLRGSLTSKPGLKVCSLAHLRHTHVFTDVCDRRLVLDVCTAQTVVIPSPINCLSFSRSCARLQASTSEAVGETCQHKTPRGAAGVGKRAPRGRVNGDMVLTEYGDVSPGDTCTLH